MTTTRYECVVGVLARSFLTSAARGVSYADFNTTRDATTRAQKKIFSFGFLIKKVSIHPLKKKLIQQRGLRLTDDDEEDKEEDKEDKEENIMRAVVDALRFALGRRLFLERRRSATQSVSFSSN